MDTSALRIGILFKITLIVVQLILTLAGNSDYKTFHVEDYCNGQVHQPIRLTAINTHSSSIIRLAENGPYKNGMNCQIRIKPPYDESSKDKSSEDEDDHGIERYTAEFGVVLTIKTIDLRRNDQYQRSRPCLDLLTVSIQRNHQFVQALSGCASDISGKSVASWAQKDFRDLLVEFSSANLGPRIEDGFGFQLTVTSFAVKTGKGCPAAWGGDTSTNWFECSTKDRCVWRGLTCDERDNCGDDSDEWWEDGAKCGTNRKQAVMGVGISLAAVAILAVIIIVCCKRRRKSSSSGRAPPATAPLINPSENEDWQRRRPPGSRLSSVRSEYGTIEEADEHEPQPPPPPYDYGQQPLAPPPPYRE